MIEVHAHATAQEVKLLPDKIMFVVDVKVPSSVVKPNKVKEKKWRVAYVYNEKYTEH